MSPTKTWVVYLHENLVNGKKYFGITCQKPERRWGGGACYKNSSYFYSAIKKYGWHAFRHEILYVGLSKEEAEQLEIKLIADYGTLNPENGYNLDPGGGGTSSPTLETRKKISDAKRRYYESDEARRKASEAQRGHKATPETRLRLSEAHRGYVMPQSQKSKISEALLSSRRKKRTAVVCIETAEVFVGMSEAGRAKGVPTGNISKCCSGQRETAGGYHWEYYDDTPIFDTRIFAGKEVKENDR